MQRPARSPARSRPSPLLSEEDTPFVVVIPPGFHNCLHGRSSSFGVQLHPTPPLPALVPKASACFWCHGHTRAAMRALRSERGAAGASDEPNPLVEAAQDLLTEFFAQRWSHKVLVIQYKYYMQLGSGMSEAALCAAACAALGVKGFSVLDANASWLPGVAHLGRSNAERSQMLLTLNHPLLPPVPSRAGLTATQMRDQIQKLRDGTLWARAVMCSAPGHGKPPEYGRAHAAVLAVLLLGLLARLWYG